MKKSIVVAASLIVIGAAVWNLWRVRVTLERGTSGRSDYSDDQGRFCIEPLYATGQRVELEARHPDFAPLRTDPFPLAAAMRPIELRVGPGHQVTARVVDERGAIVPGTLIWIEGADTDGLDPEHLAPGTTGFRGLPLADVVFFTTIGGQRFECRQSTAVAEARIRVPVAGKLEVTAPTPGNDDETSLRARLLRANGEELTTFSVNAAGDRMTSGEQIAIPGSYVVELVTNPSDESAKTVLGRRAIEVEAGRLTRCAFPRSR